MGNTNSNTSASATGALVAGGALAFYLARCHREASPCDAGESKGSDGGSADWTGRHVTSVKNMTRAEIE